MENKYEGNTAEYGKNYASYPFSLKIMAEDTKGLIPVSSIQEKSLLDIEILGPNGKRTEYFSGE